VNPESLCRVLKTVFQCFQVAEDAEISMEANPGTVTREAMRLYRKAGVNRISLGLQSARNEELKLLGRIHSYEDFLNTYQTVRECGFDNVNVDLISALPGQGIAEYEETLKKVLKLNPQPEHLSAYSLIIEEGTLFYTLYGEERDRLYRTGEPQSHLPPEETEREMYDRTRELLGHAGYHRYEISNYCKEGRECRHNQVYWQRGDYLGFGLGAASLINNVRFQNTRKLSEYEEKKEKCLEKTILSKKEQMEEFMFLGLRLTKGVEKQRFYECFRIPMDEIYGQVLSMNEEQGLLVNGERVFLTEKGISLSNYVMAQFLLD
jgi:oxygen-independent coproporphyrinogen-3 oxidase